MAITTEDRRTPELPSPTPPRTPRRGRAMLAWGAGIAALAATTALVIAVVANDHTTPEPSLHTALWGSDCSQRPHPMPECV